MFKRESKIKKFIVLEKRQLKLIKGGEDEVESTNGVIIGDFTVFRD